MTRQFFFGGGVIILIITSKKRCCDKAPIPRSGKQLRVFSKGSGCCGHVRVCLGSFEVANVHETVCLYVFFLPHMQSLSLMNNMSNKANEHNPVTGVKGNLTMLGSSWSIPNLLCWFRITSNPIQIVTLGTGCNVTVIIRPIETIANGFLDLALARFKKVSWPLSPFHFVAFKTKTFPATWERLEATNRESARRKETGFGRLWGSLWVTGTVSDLLWERWSWNRANQSAPHHSH